MPINALNARNCLKALEFPRLFIDELGWDRHSGTLEITVDDHTFQLKACAQKRGMAVFVCTLNGASNNGHTPNPSILTKVGNRVAKSAHEHILIFVQPKSKTQTWQWVRHEVGKPDRYRRHTIYSDHSGEALVQKLDALAFTLDEEAKLTLPEVTGRARRAFDVERVTKRFYDNFQKEHRAFLSFIDGIDEQGDREWYSSIMLNRLMFIYFIQKKGFLDNDRDYLINKLREVQRTKGKDHFLSFYRYFLRRLMHDGFGKARREKELESLIGSIPYLNGGIFDEHELETKHTELDIPDEAFERVFEFFDRYQWHLDERPLRDDMEINPDVLGYIFEKYINQKQMGAYYTKEDITEYIGKNTIIPFLFDAAKKECEVAFRSGSALWRLPKDDPERYIYQAVRHGIIDNNGDEIPLPANIAEGVNDVSKRKSWNTPAEAPFALPTETWREHVARRQRCMKIRQKLANGEIEQINDFITLNLDIRQFAQDVIESCEGPELLRAFYHAITNVTILDPTCGSGAFLFAALNILEPLYEACLERMEQFIADAKALANISTAKQPKITKAQATAYDDYRGWLKALEEHPNRSYFIYKSIILNNLFGVDIMEEATEICRLRMFLKLVAQVEPDGSKPNLGIEPLPDIDFNIRAGNTLIGFTSIDEVRKSQEDRLGFAESDIREIDISAEAVDRMFRKFRETQTTVRPDSSQMAAAKTSLRDSIGKLNDRLDRFLAGQYFVQPDNPKKQIAFDKWRVSHQPFHWITEFYGIMRDGGFNVIVGNPPYVEYNTLKGSYRIGKYSTESCGNLYAYVIERCFDLSNSWSRMGMIVQLSSICTDRMDPLQQQYLAHTSVVWASCFDDRPGKLFDGLEHIRAAILLSQGRSNERERCNVLTTNLTRWPTETRGNLFPMISYGVVTSILLSGSFPKAGSVDLSNVLGKIRALPTRLETAYNSKGKDAVYYYRSPLYWIRAMDFLPHFASESASRSVHHFKDFPVTQDWLSPVVGCIINSTIFYIWFIAYGNGRNVTIRDIISFPVPDGLLSRAASKLFDCLFERLMADFRKHSIVRKRRDGVEYQEFDPSKSKRIMDEIDAALAEHYRFTAEELDFIVNYDIKYRMGAATEDVEDE